MTTPLHYLWLQCALGVSTALRTQEILAAFPGGAGEIYSASDYDRRVAGVFTNMQLSRLRSTPLSRAESVAEESARLHMHILSPQDAAYPARLLQIPNYPLVLYARGSVEALQGHLPLAIVGTRKASRNSVDIAARLAADLVRAGCAVVSGGALGIDCAAHWGAVQAGGVTVAVQGCGLDYNYPPDNASLRKRIAEHGAVVSEYPPGTLPIGKNFPIRNRVISGMAVGTVVIEAGERSGSLLTASSAA
ncbi:MAG: DNA-protecting protein DprA, partial [Firmicutes bacterium]|nr:DNA-protecting protein DprA [Bacillota bacterium]